MALNTLEQGQPHAHAVKEVINNYLHNKDMTALFTLVGSSVVVSDYPAIRF